MTIYITKYALSQSIQCAEARELDNGVVELCAGGYIHYLHRRRKEWHLTLNAAIERAEEMRTKKIESLQKQISALQKLTFL